MAEGAVSVVVPTRDRPSALYGCLEALAASELPPGGLEVVVVDDGGSCELEPILERVAALELRLLRLPWGGPAAARNAGIAAARGEIVLFTDDDCRPERSWARQLAAAIGEAAEPVLAGGRTVNALGANAFACASQVVLDFAYDYHGGFVAPTFFASNNLGARRAALESLRGFDPCFVTAEDRDLCDRWRLQGWSLRGAPRALVSHVHELDLRGFVKQHFGYGRGAYRLHRARSRRLDSRYSIDLRFHLQALRALPRESRGLGRAGLWLSPLLALWQLANLAGFLYAAMRGESTSRT